MTLDDVYGPEHDRFPLEQERTLAARMLEWGDATDWRCCCRLRAAPPDRIAVCQLSLRSRRALPS